MELLRRTFFIEAILFFLFGVFLSLDAQARDDWGRSLSRSYEESSYPKNHLLRNAQRNTEVLIERLDQVFESFLENHCEEGWQQSSDNVLIENFEDGNRFLSTCISLLLTQTPEVIQENHLGAKWDIFQLQLVHAKESGQIENILVFPQLLSSQVQEILAHLNQSYGLDVFLQDREYSLEFTKSQRGFTFGR